MAWSPPDLSYPALVDGSASPSSVPFVTSCAQDGALVSIRGIPTASEVQYTRYTIPASGEGEPAEVPLQLPDDSIPERGWCSENGHASVLATDRAGKLTVFDVAPDGGVTKSSEVTYTGQLAAATGTGASALIAVEPDRAEPVAGNPSAGQGRNLLALTHGEWHRLDYRLDRYEAAWISGDGNTLLISGMNELQGVTL